MLLLLQGLGVTVAPRDFPDSDGRKASVRCSFVVATMATKICGTARLRFVCLSMKRTWRPHGSEQRELDASFLSYSS